MRWLSGQSYTGRTQEQKHPDAAWGIRVLKTANLRSMSAGYYLMPAKQKLTSQMGFL